MLIFRRYLSLFSIPSLLSSNILAFWLLLIASQAAFSADSDLEYRLGLALGVRNIEFEVTSIAGPTFVTLENGMVFPGTTGGDLRFKFDEPLYFASFSGAAIYDDFYVSAVLELPIQSEDTDLEIEATGSGDQNDPLIGTENRKSELDQVDFTVTFGYQVWKGLSVFSGYKYTEFNLKSKEPSFLLFDKDQRYTEEGLFLGASYAWQFGNAGTLALSFGYARLDTEFSEDNVASTPPNLGFTLGEFTYNGSADGLSYGAQWNGRLTKKWRYIVSIKQQSYNSDNNATTIPVLVGDNFISQNPNISIPVISSPIPVTNIDAEHTDTLFSAGLQYVF